MPVLCVLVTSRRTPGQSPAGWSQACCLEVGTCSAFVLYVSLHIHGFACSACAARKPVGSTCYVFQCLENSMVHYELSNSGMCLCIIAGVHVCV